MISIPKSDSTQSELELDEAMTIQAEQCDMQMYFCLISGIQGRMIKRHCAAVKNENNEDVNCCHARVCVVLSIQN